MRDRPQVSIITPNYNGARFLRAAIQSIKQQSLTSWQLIIVDDASTDDSVSIANDEAASDTRIKLVRQDSNLGPGAARNRALDIATGRWLAIFDGDDLMLPNRLESMISSAGIADAAIIADNLLVFSETNHPRPFLQEPSNDEPRWIDLAAFIESGCLYSCLPDLGYVKPIIRADAVRALGLRYDEALRIGEDYDFLARLMAQGHRLLLLPEALYLYRKHSGSISHRLHADHIIALMDATERFARESAPHATQVAIALHRRRHSLQSLLTFDAVIAALKQRAFIAALRLSLPRPHMWPLLTRPLTARLKRHSAPRARHSISDDDAPLASPAHIARSTS
jgi:succinoglycan biosynthesis protein ExoO